MIGPPHERWTEAITAVVVPGPGETVDPAALITALRQRLDGFKVPKTSTGKIQKNRLRDDHRSHYES